MLSFRRRDIRKGSGQKVDGKTSTLLVRSFKAIDAAVVRILNDLFTTRSRELAEQHDTCFFTCALPLPPPLYVAEVAPVHCKYVIEVLEVAVAKLSAHRQRLLPTPTV
jgi:hypothetical protein